MPFLLVACAGPREARLDAHGLALAPKVASAGAAPEPVNAATAKASGPSAGTATSGTVFDHQLEARLRRELHERRTAGGASALEQIEPGTSVESRLRFALSRVVLARPGEAAAALNALTVDVPDCALGWFLLGQARRYEGDAPGAVQCMRRARALQREQALSPHPALDFELALALLQTDDAEEGIRLLREQLATGAQRVAAAALLARYEADVGEFEAAQAALDAVLDDIPDEPTLVVAKAELLANQLRHDEAAALLDARGGRVPAPALLQTRASLQRQRGDFVGAAGSIAELIDKHAEDASVKAVLPRLQAVRAELEAERATNRRARRRVLELVGVLRYAKQPAERGQAVRDLCQGASPQAAQVAVRWGLRDSNEFVRVAALQAGLPTCANPADLVLTGLRDSAAVVRAAAGTAAARLPERTVFSPLVEALDRETDPDAFRTLHRALATTTGRAVALPFDGERDPAARAQVAAQWRAQLQQAAPADATTGTEAAGKVGDTKGGGS